MGFARLARLRRNATPLTMYAGDVRISPTVSSPATVFSTILVPANFASWSLPEREAALAHERAHIENKDFHVQALAQLHRHLFWFNPLAWWLPRRLALLSEHLSDDAALAASSNAPAAYAELLIACARKSLHGEQAVAMAGTSTLASRIDRILDGKRCSVRVNRWAFVGMAAALIPLAASAATFKAQSEQEALLPRTGSALGQQLPVTRATSGNVVLPHTAIRRGRYHSPSIRRCRVNSGKQAPSCSSCMYWRTAAWQTQPSICRAAIRASTTQPCMSHSVGSSARAPSTASRSACGVDLR